MNHTIKFSIITPSFNQGKYIERTIQSVLNQTYNNIEYIIIDGGSTDDSTEVIKKYAYNLKYWVSEKDNGQTDAINKGLKHITGDVLIWLNSDDWFEPDALEKVVACFNKYKSDVVCGKANLHFDKKIICKQTSGENLNLEKIVSSGHIMQPATFFKYAAIKKYLPLNSKLHFMMDHHLWLQYLMDNGTKRINYIENTVANVTMHIAAKSVNKINMFRHDKGAIYQSLFLKLGQQLYFPEKYRTENLTMKIYGCQEKINFKKINFDLLTENLFFRNELGDRTKIDFSIFWILLQRFPLKFIAYCINKSVRK
jgi:glycosyltransferase involved in cell wall biosynthesis